MAAGGHHLGVAHRDAGDVFDRHCLLVVGEQIGRCPAHPAQGRVEAGDEGAQRAVPGRDDHPEAAPGHPGAEQVGAPAADAGALAPVELQPHPGLGDPRPVAAAMAGPPRLLGLGHRPAGGALVAGEAHGHEALVHLVGADDAVGAIDKLLDLLQERVDEAWPAGR